jgi:DNA-binding CsgD family transcriptional regulator
LIVRGGKLLAENVAAPILRRHIEAALWSGIRPSSPDLDAVAVPTKGGLPLIVQAYRLHGAMREGFARGRVAVIVSDPNVASTPTPTMLRRLFGLTESEARLAHAASDGASLPEAADLAGISYQTARSYMKSVLSKTGARGQAELVAFLTRLASKRAGG